MASGTKQGCNIIAYVNRQYSSVCLCQQANSSPCSIISQGNHSLLGFSQWIICLKPMEFTLMFTCLQNMLCPFSPKFCSNLMGTSSPQHLDFAARSIPSPIGSVLEKLGESGQQTEFIFWVSSIPLAVTTQSTALKMILRLQLSSARTCQQCLPYMEEQGRDGTCAALLLMPTQQGQDHCTFSPPRSPKHKTTLYVFDLGRIGHS